MTVGELFEASKNPAVIAIASFLSGFFVSRFTLTKKDRLDLDNVRFRNSQDLMEKQQATYSDFIEALRLYSVSESPGIDDFYRISKAGEKYLYQQCLIASAILSENVQDKVRDQTFLPRIFDVVDRTLPAYHLTLKGIAAHHRRLIPGFPLRPNSSAAAYSPALSVLISAHAGASSVRITLSMILIAANPACVPRRSIIPA